MNVTHLKEVEASNSVRRSGAALVMTVWLLSSMLILCVFVRLLRHFRQRSWRRSPETDEVLIVTVGLFALTSMFIMSTTVTGTATDSSALQTVSTGDSQVKSYVSTILFVIALSLSKMPLILWLKRLELLRVYRVCTIALGCTVLAYMIASSTGVILQCQLPKPWDIQMGRCIPLQPFWTAMIAIDITLDVTLIVLPIVTTLSVQQRNESRTALIISLRILLVPPSLMRLIYLQRPIPSGYNPTLESLPYAVTTQCQIAIAAVLSCTPGLPCLAALVEHRSTNTPVTLKQHWSGSSFGSDIASDYFASLPTTLVKEPLPSIQASMATPTSSCHGSMVSLPSPLRGKLAAAPARPPSPAQHQRPDMSMFTRRATMMRTPPVALLRDSCDDRASGGISKQNCDVVEAVRTSKHVKFDV